MKLKRRSKQVITIQKYSKASLTFGQISQLLRAKMETNWTLLVATNVQKYFSTMGTNLAPLGRSDIQYF